MTTVVLEDVALWCVRGSKLLTLGFPKLSRIMKQNRMQQNLSRKGPNSAASNSRPNWLFWTHSVPALIGFIFSSEPRRCPGSSCSSCALTAVYNTMSVSRSRLWTEEPQPLAAQSPSLSPSCRDRSVIDSRGVSWQAASNFSQSARLGSLSLALAATGKLDVGARVHLHCK